MQKIEIAKRVAEETGLEPGVSAEAVDAILDAIKASLVKGEPVHFRDFCRMSVRRRKKRIARNPKTGEIAFISPGKVVRCQFGEKVKKTVDDFGKGGV